MSFDSILMYENVDTTSYFRDTVKNALDASNATTTVNKTAAVNMQTANNQETPYIRAALGYLPYDKLDIYGAQLRWFVHSWREMLKHQDPDWRTDVVVVSEAADLEIFHELNCTSTPRNSSTQPSACRIVAGYTPLTQRDKQFAQNRFGDSIDSVVYAAAQQALTHYNGILRTDWDTFLTPAFAGWRPSKLAVGMGQYCFDGQITCHRLHRIAKDMGLEPPNGQEPVDNVGSTWFGDAATVVKCSQISMDVMRYLDKYEFTQIDRDRTAHNWPGWYYGVLSMYSGQIAINHCAQEIGFEKRDDMLDFPSTSNESVWDHAHLHCWQNNRMFSKSEFVRHRYDSISLSSLNTTMIKEYALFNALQSRANGSTVT